jgi:hypothetical protein
MSMKGNMRLFPTLGMTLLLIAAGVAHATMPVQKLAAVVVRALAYDRSLKSRVGPHLDVLVLHDGGPATHTATEVLDGLNALRGVVVQGAPLQASVVVVTDVASVGAAIAANGPDVVWVCGSPTFQGALLPTVITEARARHITTVSLEPALVEAGVMLGVDGSGDKPKIVVNLGEARAAGVDFAADLLKLARIIR